ncbi:MAG: MmgE/PrpD family protein, partial [Betaproteobacteria bacterium]|nr:MmgE/PrpD family protein [Betaproteobacteria bacterium]
AAQAATYRGALQGLPLTVKSLALFYDKRQVRVPPATTDGLVALAALLSDPARGKFGLAELEEAALRDPDVLALADRVDYEADPNSEFPKSYSGEVIVRLKDGRELSHREQINRGAADRPLSNKEIIAKFMDNAQLAVSPLRAGKMRDAILAMDDAGSAREFASVLGA